MRWRRHGGWAMDGARATLVAAAPVGVVAARRCARVLPRREYPGRRQLEVRGDRRRVPVLRVRESVDRWHVEGERVQSVRRLDAEAGGHIGAPGVDDVNI